METCQAPDEESLSKHKHRSLGVSDACAAQYDDLPPPLGCVPITHGLNSCEKGQKRSGLCRCNTATLQGFFCLAEAFFERANGKVGLLFVNQKRR